MTIGLSSGESYESEFHLQDAIQGEKPVIGSSDTRSKELYVVRHGDTAFNEGEGDERIRGWSPVPLNEDGIDQAHETAKGLKGEGITSLVSSDLPRAKQTANIIGKEIGVEPTFTPDLRTWDMGDLTGESLKDHKVRCAEHVTDKPDEPIPGGESFNTFKDRALKGATDALGSDPSGKTAIVTHNSVERVLAAWDHAGQPEDGSIHAPTYLKEGEDPGGHKVFSIRHNTNPGASLTDRAPNASSSTVPFEYKDRMDISDPIEDRRTMTEEAYEARQARENSAEANYRAVRSAFRDPRWKSIVDEYLKNLKEIKEANK
jgi:broad specificity phosphatase PhoE